MLHNAVTFLIFGITITQTLARANNFRTAEVLRLLKAPEDNAIQSEIKEAIAQYLVEMTYSDESIGARYDAGSTGNAGIPVPFGKHKHNSQQRDRYNELLQKLQEQQLQLQQLKQTAAAPPSPVAIQEAKQESLPAPVAPVPVQVSSVAQTPAPPPVQKQDSVTPIPIIAPTVPATVAPAQEIAVPAAGAPPPATAAPPPATAAPTTTTLAPSTRPTVDPVHHINQVNKILGNVANGNIVGIVDESLAIRAPPPVRNLVTNIMKVIFCNPFDRLFGRCSQNQVDASNNSVKGK